MKTRVIGLGNTILTDDGAGVHVAREVARRLAGTASDVNVVETEVAGLALLELMVGWDRVILVDAVQFEGVDPGTVVRIDPSDLRTSLRLRSVHDVDLPTVLELGRQLGLTSPREVIVLGIEAADARTFGERLTPPVQAGVARAVEQVMDLLRPDHGDQPGGARHQHPG